MKNLFLLLSALFLINSSNAQNYQENSKIQLTVNYGSSLTLGGELLTQQNKFIIGVGYSGYIGTNTSRLSLSQNNYHFKNESLYLTCGYEVNKFVVGFKIGKQNNADFKKEVLTVNSLGNPNSYTFTKDANNYNLMKGIFLGYKLTQNFRVNLSFDTFNSTSLGFTVGF